MSKLVIPTDGPCAGHPCDNCWTCRRGRCCRRDNPDYKLPEMGEWDGPIYGDIGVLADDGTRVECHCCGQWFKLLVSHITRVHDITPDEYRAIFGLNRTQGLISAQSSRVLATRPCLVKQADVLRIVAKRGHESFTPEQRSALFTGRKARKQTVLGFHDPGHRGFHSPESFRKSGETRRQKFASGELPKPVPPPTGAQNVGFAHAKLRELRTSDPEWQKAVNRKIADAHKKRIAQGNEVSV